MNLTSSMRPIRSLIAAADHRPQSVPMALLALGGSLACAKRIAIPEGPGAVYFCSFASPRVPICAAVEAHDGPQSRRYRRDGMPPDGT
jgi:hypothetical protein